MTRKWERRIPFSTYVRRVTNTVPANNLLGQAILFPKFTSLPTELQLRILGFCSACTLFQLTHVSPDVRAEASKLFWANPAAYFSVDASWLLDGGYPGYQCYDSAFLQNVQKIEVEYEPSTNSDICPRSAGGNEIRQDRIDTFWDSIKQRFPGAKNVIINQNGQSGVWRGANAVPRPLEVLLRACPSTIQASALVLEKQDLLDIDTGSVTKAAQTWKRSTYRMIGSNAWEKLEPTRSDTVLLPTKHCTGLVGEFGRLRRRCFLVKLQHHGLWPLAIEALDRYHFGGSREDPFSCPLAGCDAYFKAAGAWTIHAAELHYRHSSQFSILPDKIKALFEERAG